MLSPAGAVLPTANDPADAGKAGDALSLRYGRWQYDSDDAIHDNFGVTWAHQFAFARTELAVTGAYALVECGTCSGWQMFSVSLRSQVFRYAKSADIANGVRASVSLRVEAGGARYKGGEGSSTFSLAGTVPLEVTLPLTWTHSIGLLFQPGIGYGSISSAGISDHGIDGILGGAVAWGVTSHLTLNVGVQRVVIPGSTSLVGASVTWKLPRKHTP
jgi:hypothetical protein